MAFEQNLSQLGHLTAAADYSATTAQYKAVYQSSASAATIAATAGREVVGILQNNPASGKPCEIAYFGASKALLGGTVAANDPVTVDANGKIVAATKNSEYVLGRALLGGAADEVGTILITHPGFGSTVAGGRTITIPIALASITGAGDVVTTITPGYAGTITSVEWVTGRPVTTAAKAAALNLEIGTTNLTGGVVSLTSANSTPLGAVVAGTAITAANAFTATDTISVEAASVTAFAEGDGFLLIHVR